MPLWAWYPRSLTWDCSERVRSSVVVGILEGRGRCMSQQRAVGAGPSREKQGHVVPWVVIGSGVGLGLVLGLLQSQV